MGHNLWLHFGVDEHPFVPYFDVRQEYRVFDPQPAEHPVGALLHPFISIV